MTTPADKAKLIVHIGAGKTGSSSIQFTLRDNQDHLKQHGFKYLGLMLEHVAEKVDLGWNFTGGSQKLFDRPLEQATDEIYGLLSRELAALPARGVHTAIWSNEWMFTREARIIPALERIRADGHEVRIICYIRRHDKWARSAYAQWGIKHKAYPGRVRPFSEWSKGRSFAFYPAVAPWLEAFPGQVSLYNYDTAGEVVSHFCKAVGYAPAVIVQDNVTPTEEVMAAWAVFNSRFEDEVLPIRFMAALRPSGAMAAADHPLPPMAALYPTEADLARVRERNAADRAALNKVLEAQGEAPLPDDPVRQKDVDIDPWKMNQMLLTMVFSLQQQVNGLRNRIQALETK